MTVRLIADLHLGHKNIAKFSGGLRGGVKDVEEHDNWIIDRWNSVVTKQDVTWILGDVAFNNQAIKKMNDLNGVKHLILGNHDLLSMCTYREYFNKVHGFMKYKGFWLSHSPIRDLRGIKNIHGHTHSGKLIDGDYICVCVEALGGIPISLEDINDLI